jgi:hypothetical protein
MPLYSHIVEEWRDKLFEARMKNIREVRDANGEVVVFKSDSEMAAAIAAAERAMAAGARPHIHTVRFTSSKGR